ncbi:MAG TPA: hypothetical protein ACFCUY_03630 [Xenococcaceae cyanobacterium]
MKQHRRGITKQITQKFRGWLRLVKNASIYLTLELGIYLIFIGLISVFIWLGFTTTLAIVFSLILLLVSLLISTITQIKQRIFQEKARKKSYFQVRGEVKLADNIAQILATKSPKEWEEYQDWLYDILLTRRQLLERNCPKWKVSVLTYWRLLTFCLTISLLKLKRLTRTAK